MTNTRDNIGPQATTTTTTTTTGERIQLGIDQTTTDLTIQIGQIRQSIQQILEIIDNIEINATR